MTDEQPKEFVQAPAGTFFRVSPPDRDGDLWIALRKEVPSRWFGRNRSVTLHSEYAIEGDVAYFGAEYAVSRVMQRLVRLYESQQKKDADVAAVVGDYPPKQIEVNPSQVRYK